VDDRETIARAHQPTYDAVYARIREMGDAMPPDVVHRNAMIWRAVEAALAALDLAGREAAAREEGRREVLDSLLADIAAYFAFVHRTIGEHDAIGDEGNCVGCKMLARAEGATERGRDGACTCPDLDVGTWQDRNATVKGLDPDCGQHGKGTIREGT
jgi:hypothetical protein